MAEGGATDEKGEGKKIEALRAKIDALNGAAPKLDELERALADQVGEAADIAGGRARGRRGARGVAR